MDATNTGVFLHKNQQIFYAFFEKLTAPQTVKIEDYQSTAAAILPSFARKFSKNILEKSLKNCICTLIDFEEKWGHRICFLDKTLIFEFLSTAERLIKVVENCSKEQLTSIFQDEFLEVTGSTRRVFENSMAA